MVVSPGRGCRRKGGAVSQVAESRLQRRWRALGAWWNARAPAGGVGLRAFWSDWKAGHPVLVRWSCTLARGLGLAALRETSFGRWLRRGVPRWPRAEDIRHPLLRWLDASLPVFLGLFLLGLFFNVVEPFGLDNATKAHSQRITARVLAPFYRSDAQDRIAVVMIDDHTLAARGIGWPPQYAYYDELLRRVLAQRPRAVYLDILMQQRRDYDDSYEDARLGIGEEIAAAGIPVYFGVSAPGGRSIFSGAGGARDVATSWQGAGSGYPLRIAGDYVNEQGRDAQAAREDGADTRSVALALYQAACPRAGDGCAAPANALSVRAQALPMAVQWGSTLPQRPDGAAAVACTRGGAAATGARLRQAWAMLADSFNSGRDEAAEDHGRQTCAYTFTVFEEQLDDESLREALADRVVLVGTHLVGLNDRVPSPVHQQIPGVYLHAMALDNLMTWGERRIHRTEGLGFWLGVLNAVLLSLAAGAVLLCVRGTLLRLAAMLALSVAAGLGVALWAQWGLRQPPQDWIGLLVLSLAVTYYVVNLGQRGPDEEEAGDGQDDAGETRGGAGAAGRTGDGGGPGVGVDGPAAEGAGGPGAR